MSDENIDVNKRRLFKKAAYVAPAIITMAAMPSFASAGSNWSRTQQTNRQQMSNSAPMQHRNGKRQNGR